MLKLIGAGFIILAGTLLGFYQASMVAARPKQIRMLHHALKRLETEISYGLTPLPEAFRSIAGQLSEPLASLFKMTAEKLEGEEGRSVFECWTAAVAEIWPRSAMKKAEREIIERLGGSLGISDREDQMKHLQLCMVQLQNEEASASEDRRRYETMWRSLGLLISVLVVILMY